MTPLTLEGRLKKLAREFEKEADALEKEMVNIKPPAKQFYLGQIIAYRLAAGHILREIEVAKRRPPR